MVIPRKRLRAARLAATLLCIASGVHRGAATTGTSPVITAQPQPQTAFEGATVNLGVAATSTTRISYRWRFHGTNLPGAFPGQFTPLLALQEVTAAASGPYTVVVSNSFGAVTSATAVVTVNQFTGHGVGYVNLAAVPGYSLFASPLVQFGSNQAVARQIPVTHNGVSLFKLDGNGFIANNYLDGWSDPGMTLTLGEGWFFHNPNPAPFVVTFVGAVIEGRLVNHLPEGHSICANIIPQAGALSSELGFPITPGVEVVLFDKSSQRFINHQAGEMSWFPVEPRVAVSEAFWVREPFTQDWVRDFTVIPHPMPPVTYRIVQPTLGSETGEINFFTYNPDGVSGRVLDFNGSTPLTSDFLGQLYAGTNETESALSPAGTPAAFLEGAGAGYIRAATVRLPGVRGGQAVFLQLRVWERCAGDSYEQAVMNGSAAGRSTVFTATAHATIENGGPGLPPRNANTFPSFQIAPGQGEPMRVARIRCVGATVEVCFATQPGQVYCLQKNSSCAEPAAWTTVPGAGEIIGTGRVVKITETVAPTQCFYRICHVR